MHPSVIRWQSHGRCPCLSIHTRSRVARNSLFISRRTLSSRAVCTRPANKLRPNQRQVKSRRWQSQVAARLANELRQTQLEMKPRRQGEVANDAEFVGWGRLTSWHPSPGDCLFADAVARTLEIRTMRDGLCV